MRISSPGIAVGGATAETPAAFSFMIGGASAVQGAGERLWLEAEPSAEDTISPMASV
jgi:hypothetical protein